MFCPLGGANVRCARRIDWLLGRNGSSYCCFCACCSPWLHAPEKCCMLFTLYTLPQLAVSAKLLCLLMVVICGAVPSMVRSVRLYNQCSYNTITINMKGQVFASDTPQRFENLTIESVDFKSVTILADESKRYLCFNKRWKLVGWKKLKGAMCQFSEEMEEGGYSRYRSVENDTNYVAFKPDGRPIRGDMARRQPRCTNFMKFDHSFNIQKHNSQIAGSSNNSAEAPDSPQSQGSHQHNNPFLRMKQTKLRNHNVATPRRIRHKHNQQRNNKKFTS